MASDPGSEVQRLFDELVELDSGARAARLAELAPADAVARDVASLLQAADRVGDFLGLLAPFSAVASPAAPERLVNRRYRLDRSIGQGAMGEVFKAWDCQLERTVALKFLHQARRAGRTATGRFIAEARAAARLEHPNVAIVHDIGHADERGLFIVMAYYGGETLRDRVRHGPLPVQESVRIATQLAGALSCAHDAGIVHRDVKPANVLFDAAGEVRLADFGVAKLAGSDVTDPRITVGTVAYMSPEQARGEVLDARSDLWSLGVVLFEMLWGRRPIVAPGPAGIRKALLDDQPITLPEGGAPLPPALVALVNALLEKDRARRPGNAADVCRMLSQIAAETAPAISATSDGPGLPPQMTSFVGRARELDVARALLLENRLLTLTGPGGAGKTRLALQLASRVRDAYPDGVAFVPLAEVGDSQLVGSAIAFAIGVRDVGGAALGERVINLLRSKRYLLVLDNFEHVQGAALFVGTLLASCPNVTVLVTSRSPLALQGEQEFPVPPLATPQRGSVVAATTEAVELFVQRARAVRPDFALDEAIHEIVAEICRRLDGLPLAIELAAARTALLPPRAMLARLEHSSALLASDAADRPARHRTMHAVIDWSYVLLTDLERQLFERLAIFVGGFTLEAASAMTLSLIDGSATVPDTLDLLDSLCKKNLVGLEQRSDDELRFFMLETVREFGLERLRAGGQEGEARRVHRVAYLTFAERAAGQLRGPSQALWFDRLEQEYPNLRIALDNALGDERDGRRDAALLAVALYRFWLTRGPLFDGVDYLRRVIDSLDSSDARAGFDAGAKELDAPLRARLFGAAGQLAGGRSMFREARGFFARSLELYREAGDRTGVAATLNHLGWQTWNIGDLAGGEAMSNEAMALHQELGNEQGVALALTNLAWIEMVRGDYAPAGDHFESAIAAHERLGDARTAAVTTSWLGQLVARRGDLPKSAALHQRALEMAEPVADRGHRALYLTRLAAIRHALGEPGDHVRDIELTYLPTLRDEGRLWPLASALTELATMLMRDGRLDDARLRAEEALEIRRRSGGIEGVAEATMLLGLLRARAGDETGATQLLTRALEIARDFGAAPVVRECLASMATIERSAGRATVDASG